MSAPGGLIARITVTGHRGRVRLRLEAQPRAEVERPVAGRAGNPPEVRAVDVHRGSAPVRFIQHTERVGADLELFALCQPDSLDHVDVQTDRTGPFDPSLSQISKLSWRRIDQEQIALSVRDRAIRERAIRALQRRD